jgi:hypothetical protein
MADEYKFPIRLRMAMERAATVLNNCANYGRRELDEDSQGIMRIALDDLDSACVEANLAVRPAAAPVAEVYGTTQSFGEGDDERFYEGKAVRLLRDVPKGTKLYGRSAPATAERSPGLRVRVGHATGYDYEAQLYAVLRGLKLPTDATVSLPHAGGATGDCTKSFFAAGCDLFIAEVSAPSTGLGMELAYADMHGVPVVCVHRSDCRPSSSVKMVSQTILGYESPEELARHVEALVTDAWHRKAHRAG